LSPAESLLVVDVGTSSVRSSFVRPDATVAHAHVQPIPPFTPAPGLVEVDGSAIARAALDTARAALAEGGPVGAVGITNQRGTTLVWDRRSGEPVAAGLGWQDLRTVGTCLELQAQGVRLAPNVSATKVSWILDQVDPQRSRGDELCFGTVDTWVAWTLAGGPDVALHVTDITNAGVTGLVRYDGSDWDDRLLDVLRIPRSMMPQIVDSSGPVGKAGALPGRPPICGIVGDQQASMIGQGVTLAGLAKATFGTGGMLNVCTGDRRPQRDAGLGGMRGAAGTYPIAAWRRGPRMAWGVEALMLSAGACVEWLRDDLEILSDVAESAEVAAACAGTDDLWFVPALFGLGTPVWDFGARGALVGVTRGTGRSQLVRAVLTGVAHRGADLLEAAESDSAMSVASLRVDGGMSANDVFVAELAEATGRVIEVSSELEATTRGAGLLAGLAIGTWRDEDELAALWSPRARIEPQRREQERLALRARWLEARARSESTIPELSGISF
jgi:glycerol kinase